MAHFAKLDKDNKVINVEVVANSVITDLNGQENEQIGINFLRELYEEPNGVWKQTSYNGNFRKNFASIGVTYDETRDAFIPVKMYDSWTFNEDTCRYDPPVPKPADTETSAFFWNEETRNWDEISMVDPNQPE
jgi:hypothetical protein